MTNDYAADERRRIVGIVLEAYARYKGAGEGRIAAVLDQLALKIEFQREEHKMPFLTDENH